MTTGQMDRTVQNEAGQASAGSAGRWFHCAGLADLPVDEHGRVAPSHPLVLEPDQARHAAEVLRLGRGDAVVLFDAAGRVAEATLDRVEPRRVTAAVRVVRVMPRVRPELQLAVALPKGPRGQDMVNQLVQLGVDRLTPLRSERATVAPRSGKLERWERVVLEACRQARRPWRMTIDEPRGLDAVLAEQAELKLLSSPGGAALADLRGRIAAAERVLVLIGPEGGWSAGELAAAASAGCVAWWLGPHVMRIETAAAAAAAILRHAAGRSSGTPVDPDAARHRG